MELEHDIAAEPIIGFRIFRLNRSNSLLKSVAEDSVWLPGQPMQSNCRFSRHGDVHDPHENCTCGIHAAKSRRMLNKAYPGLVASLMESMNPEPVRTRVFLTRPVHDPIALVSAQVRLWGHVIQHQHGYRATWGEIIPETIQWWPRLHYKHHYKVLHHLRKKYSVESIYTEVTDG